MRQAFAGFIYTAIPYDSWDCDRPQAIAGTDLLNGWMA